MGVGGSPVIFQEKMSGLMEDLVNVGTYLDDLLIINKSDVDDHLTQVGTLLCHLQGASLRDNDAKLFFTEAKIEYLGYILRQEGIRPQPEKVSTILAV